MHPALTDDIGICFLSIQSVLSTVPSIPLASSLIPRVQMRTSRGMAKSHCVPKFLQPAGERASICPRTALLCRPFPPPGADTSLPRGCFSPRLESSSMVSSFSLIRLLFKYLSPLPRTAEFPQLQHLSLLFLGLGAEMYKAVSGILSVNMFQ